MKITVLAYPNGDVFITKPSLDNNISDNMGTAQKNIRVGKIIPEGELFRVEFQLEKLQRFNRAGFPSREAAVAYEQGILDKHLASIWLD